MSRKIDRIILSVNENPDYYVFWPLVAQAWKKLYPEALVTLGLVCHDCSPLIHRLEKYGEVDTYTQFIPGINTANLAKVYRYYLAAECQQRETVMINDIDLIPMRRDYYQKSLSQWSGFSVLAIGADVYKDKCPLKWPAGYMTAMGMRWKQLINSRNYYFNSLVEAFKQGRSYDNRESITSDKFCDESLLRALAGLSGVPIQHLPYPIVPGMNSIEFNHPLVKSKNYCEAHHLIPISKHMDKIEFICNELRISFNPDWINEA